MGDSHHELCRVLAEEMDLGDEEWERYFGWNPSLDPTRQPINRKNRKGESYAVLLLTNWAFFVAIPTWLSYAAYTGMRVNLSDHARRQAWNGQSWGRPTNSAAPSPKQFRSETKIEMGLLAEAHTLSELGPFDRLGRLERSWRVASSLRRLPPLCDAIYKKLVGEGVIRSRLEDDRVVERARLARANIAALAEEEADRQLKRAGNFPCFRALKAASFSSESPLSYELLNSGLGRARQLAHGIAVQAAISAADSEDIKRFTPPGRRDIDEWAEKNFSPDDELAVAAARSLEQPTEALRRTMAILLDEIFGSSGRTYGLFPETFFEAFHV